MNAITTVDETRQAVASLNNQLATRADQFKMVLPAHIAPEQFQRTIITAVQSDVELLKADRQSLLLACMKAAQDGLLPDKREAALVIFSTRVKEGNQWKTVKQVQYMPMVYGLRKKILQSGEISAIETNVVYLAELEAGAFIYEAGTEAALRHRPMLGLPDEEITDDKIVAAYSVAVMKDGTKSFEVMRRAEINKVRQVSQTGALGKTKYNSNEQIPPKGPWVDWFSEMARKTVMRRHSKTLPMSGDLIDVEGRDEEITARSVAAALASEEAEPARLVSPTREEAAIAEGADPATGELPRDELTEEAARAADAEGLAEMDGRSDEGEPAGEDQDDATPEDHPARALAAELTQRLDDAQILGDVLNVESEFAKQRDVIPDDVAAGVDEAITTAKARFTKGAK